MRDLLQAAERTLKIPKEKLIEEGIKRLLEVEWRDLSIEIGKLGERYGVDSFDGLWSKLESGEVTESDCFDDLTRLEYLEIEKEKISRLLHDYVEV